MVSDQYKISKVVKNSTVKFFMWSVINTIMYCTGFKQLANHAHTYNYSIVTTKLQEQQQVWTSWTSIQWVTMYMQLMIL